MFSIDHRRWRTLLAVLFLLTLAAEVTVAEQSPLPEPLSLSFALSLADDAHPNLLLDQARLESSLARQQQAAATDDWTLRLVTELKAIDPSDEALDRTRNDSNIKLKLSKPLFDNGRSVSLQREAESAVRADEMVFLDTRQQRRLEIQRNYLDVLLADLRYIRDNESMTMGFLKWDKARERFEMGQLSEIEVLELESIFQQRRRVWVSSQNQQRATRQALAISLNRPDQLSSDLSVPVFELDRKLPEFEPLLAQVLKSNPMLKAKQERTRAAMAAVEAARSSAGISVHGELSAAAYNRSTGSRHPLSASLQIQIPLYDNQPDAVLAAERARLHQRRAEQQAMELELRQAVLDLWLRIKTLQAQQQEIDALGAYRDLYSDRSRALYELEVKSDLGDAETRISDYRLQKASTEYALAMAWARLDALQGLLVTALTDQEEEIKK